MAVSSLHVLRQGPMLVTLGKTAVRALLQQVLPARPITPVATPGPETMRSFPPPSRRLLDAFVTYLGGDVDAYRDIVPPHFFPQWSLPVAANVTANLPYPIARVLNAGVRLQINAAIPRGEALHVRAQLTNVDDDGRRVILTQRVITSTKSAPNALQAEIFAFVPLKKSAKEDKKTNGEDTRPRVPEGAREVAFYSLPADEGLSFAKLTGDFNPIHWVPAYAKAAGFPNVILHGFGTFARAFEGLTRGLLDGDPRKLKLIDVKFVKPLVLPHRVGVYVHDHEVFVGDGTGELAYMTGRFDTGED